MLNEICIMCFDGQNGTHTFSLSYMQISFKLAHERSLVKINTFITRNTPIL